MHDNDKNNNIKPLQQCHCQAHWHFEEKEVGVKKQATADYLPQPRQRFQAPQVEAKQVAEVGLDDHHDWKSPDIW